VPGLVSYTMMRSGDGGVSVTVCKDKAGVEESVKVAREWIQKNASNIHANPPVVTEGSVIVQIK
jgi:restriction endonuclease Mrr